MLPAAKQRSPIEIARTLAEKPQSLQEYLDLILAGRPASAALVLYVDQLEELFTQVSKEHRSTFAEFVTQVTMKQRLRVLATLRADFLSQSTAEAGLAALLRVGTFVLGPPGPAALADMVRRPAERAGLALEDGLADKILTEAGGDPGALPLIAFCLEELYHRTAPQHQLTLDGYEAMGGLRGAIGQRADNLLAELGDIDEIDLNNALSKVFDSLVYVKAGKAARQRASRDELMAAPAPIPQLVDKLTDPGRLLVAENTGGRPTIMLAHEALLQEWAALRDWLGTDHLILLQKGVEVWNAWRAREPSSRPDLSRADLSGADLQGVDLREAKLSGANLSGADLQTADLRQAELSGANLSGTDLQGADLRQAELSGANLRKANLCAANLQLAALKGADLRETKLIEANLKGADLGFAVLVDTDLTNADLSGCRVYGISAWRVKVEGAKQSDLIITEGEPELTLDNIEIVNLTDLLLHNEKIRDVIDTLASKVVLILGRFTYERKAVLDALRDELRKRDYLPILFDFDKPVSRSTDETITLLARMARFVIADFSDAKSVLNELRAIVPELTSVPVQPVIVASQEEPAMFDFFRHFPWFLPVHRYDTPAQLLRDLGDRVIRPAEAKVLELRASLSS
jgi:hypothetical protein